MDRILYSPLWLGIEPPKTEMQDIVNWAIAIKTSQLEVLKTFDRESTIYDAGYELMHDYGFVSMVTHPLTGEWFENFDIRFPQLASYFDKYPLKNKRIFAQSYLANEDMSQKVHAKFHMDRDETTLGFRFSACVDDKPRLIFRKIKTPYLNFYRARHGRRCTFPNHHADVHALRVKVLPGSHAWVMDTEVITHAVDGYPINDRSIFVIYGELDMDKYEEIMNDTRLKYPEYILTEASMDSQLKELKESEM